MQIAEALLRGGRADGSQQSRSGANLETLRLSPDTTGDNDETAG